MMLMLMDNRSFDPLRLVPNVSVEPRLSPGFAGETHFSPGTPAWSHFNRRRAELIRRKAHGALSRAEEEELAWLQRETLAAVDLAFPRPAVDLRSVAKLEKRLREGTDTEAR